MCKTLTRLLSLLLCLPVWAKGSQQSHDTRGGTCSHHGNVANWIRQ
jgi:hypothetical protein